mmetsp:Transcript_89589/g.159051  ORF Transcript_89589/g.159051 Transcript_89589/m.159051 type:complete len:226 (+) Transcript_89589:1085-1762(+)
MSHVDTHLVGHHPTVALTRSVFPSCIDAELFLEGVVETWDVATNILGTRSSGRHSIVTRSPPTLRLVLASSTGLVAVAGVVPCLRADWTTRPRRLSGTYRVPTVPWTTPVVVVSFTLRCHGDVAKFVCSGGNASSRLFLLCRHCPARKLKDNWHRFVLVVVRWDVHAKLPLHSCIVAFCNCGLARRVGRVLSTSLGASRYVALGIVATCSEVARQSVTEEDEGQQ